MAALDDILNLQLNKTTQKANTLGVPPVDLTVSNQNSGINAGSPVIPVPQLQTQPAVSAEPPTPEAPKFKSYEDIYKAGSYDPQLSEEEQQKEIKREKSRAAIAAVGDGVSAIANLVFASKGAVTPQAPNLSERNAQRYQALRQNREAKSDQYNNALSAYRMKDKDFGYQVDRNTVEDQQRANAYKLQTEQLKKQDERYNVQQQLEREKMLEDKRARTVSEQNDAKRIGMAAAGQAASIKNDTDRLAIEKSYKQGMVDYRAGRTPANSIALYDSENDNNVYIDKAKFATMAPDIFNKMITDKDFILKYSEGKQGGSRIVMGDLKKMTGNQIATFVRENWNKSKVARESVSALSLEVGADVQNSNDSGEGHWWTETK